MGSDIRRAKNVVVRWRRVLSWGHQTFSARRLPGDLANVHPATGSTPVRFPAERKLRDLVRGRCPTPRAPDGPRRALEVMSSAEDYDADLADRYGWINRALPADELEDFAGSLARRIARFPAWATPWSRPELTRSRLRPRRISSRLRSVWRVRAYPRGSTTCHRKFATDAFPTVAAGERDPQRLRRFDQRCGKSPSIRARANSASRV